MRLRKRNKERKKRDPKTSTWNKRVQHRIEKKEKRKKRKKESVLVLGKDEKTYGIETSNSKPRLEDKNSPTG